MAMENYHGLATGIASGTALIGGSGNLVTISGATITVKDAGTSNISSIFSDEGVTPLANPFTADSSGRFNFYAADGDYDITVSKTGFTSYTLLDVSFDSDPMTTRGDVIIRDATNTTARLAIGTDKQLLQSDGTDITWESSTASDITNVPAGNIVATDVQAAIDELDAQRPFRNLLINANPLINQRGFASGNTAGVGGYTLDRWKTVANEAFSFSNTANVVTMTAPASGIEQVVELLNVVGGTYTISWTGTATCTVNGTARLKGDSFTLTGGVIVNVIFLNGTVSLPQLELGSVATPFEHRDYASELVRCQRYLPAFQSGSNNDVAGVATLANTTAGLLHFQFVVEPRITPTGITVSAASDFTFLGASGTRILNSASYSANTSKKVGVMNLGWASATSLTYAGYLRGNSASAQLLWTGCEL